MACSCQYDGAGKAFSVLFGSALRPRGQAVPLNLHKLKQSKFFPTGVSDVTGLGDSAYLYVPTACRNGSKCAIHVAFHGCNQDLESIGTAFIQKTG